MPRLLALAAALALAMPAAAGPVDLDLDRPEAMSLFTTARVFGAKGRAGTCDKALQAALDKAQRKAERKDHPVILGLYGERPDSDWSLRETLSCDDSRRKAVVDATVLAVQPGDGFPEVSATRAVEILGQLAVDDPVLPTPVNQLELVGFSGHVFYSLRADHDDRFEPGVIRAERALATLREDIEPYLDDFAPRVEGIPEITGLRVVSSVEWQEVGDKPLGDEADAAHSLAQHYEQYEYYIPTPAAVDFNAGKLHERGLVGAAGIFVEPAAEGHRIDLSSRASEQITGPTVQR